MSSQMKIDTQLLRWKQHRVLLHLGYRELLWSTCFPSVSPILETSVHFVLMKFIYKPLTVISSPHSQVVPRRGVQEGRGARAKAHRADDQRPL